MSANPTARAHLLGVIEPLLPNGWKLIDTARIPSTIDAVTVIVNHTTIEPTPEAPRSTLSHGFDLYVASPHADKERADLQLDAAIVDLLTTLGERPDVRFDSAKKIDLTDRYLGWQVTLTTITAKE